MCIHTFTNTHTQTTSGSKETRKRTMVAKKNKKLMQNTSVQANANDEKSKSLLKKNISSLRCKCHLKAFFLVNKLFLLRSFTNTSYVGIIYLHAN